MADYSTISGILLLGKSIQVNRIGNLAKKLPSELGELEPAINVLSRVTEWKAIRDYPLLVIKSTDIITSVTDTTVLRLHQAGTRLVVKILVSSRTHPNDTVFRTSAWVATTDADSKFADIKVGISTDDVIKKFETLGFKERSTYITKGEPAVAVYKICHE